MMRSICTVARIEAIRLFLAFASFMGFTVYQMDVKSAFLYGNITEEVYVKQPPGFEDPAHPNKVYRVVKALFGLHQAPRSMDAKILGSKTSTRGNARNNQLWLLSTEAEYVAGLQLFVPQRFADLKREFARLKGCRCTYLSWTSFCVESTANPTQSTACLRKVMLRQQLINDVPHIRAKVAGKKILISEATIRADLLFDDENGVDCFPKQVIWDVLRDIGYEVGSDRPQDFIPSVSLPSKVFTFMRKHSTKFSCRITPLTPSMLEVVTALAAEEEHSTSPSSRAASSARDAQGSPTQSAAHSQRTDDFQEAKETEEKKHKKKCSSVNMGGNKDEGTLSEEHNVQEEGVESTGDWIGDNQSAARQSYITPRTSKFVKMKQGPSRPTPSNSRSPWKLQMMEEVARKIQAEDGILKKKERANGKGDVEERDAKKTLKKRKASYLTNTPSMEAKVDDKDAGKHGMEVEDESETAITLIHLFILWTTANGDNS
ncbi:putative ribonuclease H-like domain-containing protein [Tanacetum coccineum]